MGARSTIGSKEDSNMDYWQSIRHAVGKETVIFDCCKQKISDWSQFQGQVIFR
jgi:hypothetical protein